ncbi:hypothetical protein KG090_03760 [Carnobacteriaceae bacterium zg-ZUI240]|nr:hypothetical protein [Carnobacteriaceae bacterium zg-ZUI240]
MAKNKSGEIVHIDHANKNEQYFCPDCLSVLMIKRGKKYRAHFAHCKQCAQQSFSEGETVEHVNGKQFLYDALKEVGCDVALESYIPHLKQRPDLLVTYRQRKIAIEFQCSKISVQDIALRTEGYKRIGIDVIWICGRKNSHLTHNPYRYAFPTLLFYKLENHQLYLCNEKHTIRISPLALLKRLHYETKVSVSSHAIPPRLDQKFLRNFYSQKGEISKVPTLILEQQGAVAGMMCKQYVLLSYLWHKATSIKACQAYVKWLVKEQKLVVDDLPCVDVDCFLDEVCWYGIRQLETLGCIRIKKDGLLEKM